MNKYQKIKIEDYEEMLNRLSNSELLNLETHDLLIYGGGGHNKAYFENLKNEKYCEILWSGWPGPKWTLIFSFIPGQAGLIKILDIKRFKDIYYELASHSVSDVICAPKNLTAAIIDEAKERTWRAKFEKFVPKEPNSFFITSETGDVVKENGIEMYLYDYAIGTELNENIAQIIKNKTPHNNA